VVAGLNTAFVLLDHFLFPEDFLWMLAVRIGCNIAMGALYFFAAKKWPLRSAFVGVFAVGAMLLEVIRLAGGAGGNYTPGLMLLFLGIPVLLPFTALQAVVVVAVLMLALSLLPVVSGVGVPLNTYLLHLGFPLAAGVESVLACILDYMQRSEIERARDELKELDVAKSRFTANVHHELRTPLTLTLAPIETMLSGEFGEISALQRSYLKTVRTNGLRLLKLINNLLDLAKIEGDQLTVQRRPAQVGAVVEEIVTGARPLAERKGVRVEMRGLGGLPVVSVDPEAFEKIVVNLVGNALKFTESGGRIAVFGEAYEDGSVRLTVEDSGIGIPPEQLERVFDRFAQVDGSTTREHEGTGIGLALAKELVDLHGGRIWAESEGVGRGTRMHVVLPKGEPDIDGEAALAEPVLEAADGSVVALGRSLAAMEAELDFDDSEEVRSRRDELRLTEMEQTVERAEGAAAPAQAKAFMPAGSVPRDAPEVLVVEDNADMRQLLSFLIGQEFQLRVARNGREAMEAVRARKPDLVLTDVMMPELSGTELCAALKGDPATEGIPVVLITSKAEREMKIEGLELGADDYVTKPFHPRELLARIRSLVKLRRLQEELSERNTLLEATNEELQGTMNELKEASAQLVHAERLSALGELAAGVAHEVNNPVNFAVNALKALQECVGEVREVAAKMAQVDACEPEAFAKRIRELQRLRERLRFDERADALVELAGIVSEGLERTSKLVGDLRDFAAPDDRPRADLDLTKGLRSTVRLVGQSLAKTGIEVRVNLPTHLPRIEGEARALNQVFLNLLKNAAESLTGRSGCIDLTARPEGDAVVIELRDDGPGIAPEVREHVFEPFFTTKNAERGSGLGLSICRRIVKQHGGSIELESEPGRGTLVRLRLPVRRAARTGSEAHAS
jgi:signal transduction histidine kinase